MKKKKISLRKCVWCTQQKEKKQLIRIVKDKSGNLFIDKDGKLNGRGAYICKEGDCIENTIKNKRLNGSLRTKVSEEFYQEIRNYANMR